jgi:hypothetical protein
MGPPRSPPNELSILPGATFAGHVTHPFQTTGPPFVDFGSLCSGRRQRGAEMIKTANSISPTRTRLAKLSIVATLSACAIILLAVALIVLVLWHDSLPAVRADSAVSAERKMQQAEHPTATSSRTAMLTEDKVNSVLHDRLQKSDRLVTADAEGLHDLKVRLIGDKIQAFIVLGHRRMETTVELQGKLHSQDGRVQFDPMTGRIGALRLPQRALIDAMRQALSGAEEGDQLQMKPTISDVRVENSQVLLRYN